MFNVPIAFVVFNRPQVTRLSFEKIRAVQPSTLFLISDAARPDRVGEAEQVAQAREIAESVDWPCQLHRIYADSNMGCGRRISSGITTALKTVEQLIVLEDDCIADASFFPFCEQLLEHYRDDERIMAVTGNNFQRGQRRGDGSYYFSKYPHCWGWATWRRAWHHFDLAINDWPAFRDAGRLQTHCRSASELDYWTRIFDSVYSGKSQSWAYPWTLCCWMQHGLTIVPEVNLVTNIGFGDGATHTTKTTTQAHLPTHHCGEVVHPRWVNQHVQADTFTDQTVFSGSVRRGPIVRIERAIRKLRKAA